MSGPVALADLAAVMGWPDDPARADGVAIGVLADGLAVQDGDVSCGSRSGPPRP